MKQSAIQPGRKCPHCKGKGCDKCVRGRILPAPKPRKAVKPIRTRRHAENAAYSILRKQFLHEHRKCCILQPNGRICGAPATEVHHRKGRGRHMLDVKTWLGICNDCHTSIHQVHREWARRMGYIVNAASPMDVPPVSKVFLPYESTDP